MKTATSLLLLLAIGIMPVSISSVFSEDSNREPLETL